MEEVKEETVVAEINSHIGFNEDDFEADWPAPKEDDIPYIYNDVLHKLGADIVNNKIDRLSLVFGSSDPSHYMVTHLDAMWYIAHTLFVNTSLKTIHISYGQEVFANHEKLAFFIANAISQHPTVETLDLSFNGFTPDTAYYMGRALLRNKTIKNLNLSGNGFTDNTAAAFINALSLHYSLQTLNLSNCNLGRKSAIALSKLFKNVKSLGDVILDGNSFDGPAGIAYLMQGLQFANFDYFSLANCGLEDSVGMLLADGLKASRINAFCISSNCLTDIAGVHVVRALARSGLSSIVLDNNSFGKLTAEELESFLAKDSTRLRRLSFMDNALTEQDLTYYAQAFSRNVNLKELYIGADGFVPEFTLAHKFVKSQNVVLEKSVPSNNLNNASLNKTELLEKFSLSPVNSERESVTEAEPLIFSNNNARPVITEDSPLL